MTKIITLSLVTLLLTGCASVQMEMVKEEPIAVQPKENLYSRIPPLDGPPITIAVYGFTDKTGQMKPNDKLAVFSKAVTQGAEVFLIKSLQDAQGWFRVVERVGLDNLIKERQLIRNQREVYEGKDAKPLKPMTVAGVMIEGGIIGYDSNIRSGGSGARFLGIGGSQQYRVDEVLVSIRLISVSSGEVLLTNSVSKTIYSTQHNVGVLRFVDAGTKAVELENGAALNEPTTYAVRVSIEQAVFEMILAGEKKGLWKYKTPISHHPVSQGFPLKTEEKKDELVQSQSKQEEAAPSATTAGTAEVLTKTQTQKIVGKKGKMKDTVYVRREPNESSTRVWMFNKNTAVTVDEEQGEWIKIIAEDGKKGYIKREHINLEN